MCKTIKIDNVAIEEKNIIKHHATKYPPSPEYYTVEKEIEGIDATEKKVSIEFEGDNVEKTSWNFKIKNGGGLPTIPQSKLSKFTIHTVSGPEEKLECAFPDTFKNHLTDNKNPTLEIYGKKVLISFVAADKKTFASADFEVDSTPKVTKIFDDNEAKPKIEHEFEITANAEHTVKITFTPKSATTFSPLIYSFKLKPLDEKLALDCLFFIDNKIKPSGYEEKLNLEYTTLMVQAPGGTIGKVEIGKEGSTPLKTCTVQEKKAYKATISTAELEVKLSTNDTPDTFIIRVTPKDTNKFATTECKFKLEGTKVSDKNAEFAFFPSNDPMVIPTITEWENGVQPANPDDFGAKKASITAKTISPRAKVKYQIVDVVTLQPMQGKAIVDLTSTNHDVNFAVENIELYTDKPTKVKVWVESEAGALKDDVKGVSYITFNPIPLWWGYLNTDKLEHFRMKGYNEINVDPTKVTNGKIYILVAPWKEYTIEGFTDKGELGKAQKLYWKEVDISELTNAGSTQSEKEIPIVVKLESSACFTYKLKVKKQ